jgi:hypothetical protein
LFGRHKHRISEFHLQSQAAHENHLPLLTSSDRMTPGSVSISSRRLEVGGFMVVIENNGVFGKFPERFQKCCITRGSAV